MTIATTYLVARDHGLALAMVCLMRYAGPRVGAVAALRLPDVRLSARRGLLVIRRGKELKYREVPLVVEAREPLEDYLTHRRDLAQPAGRNESAVQGRLYGRQHDELQRHQQVGGRVRVRRPE